MEIGKDYIGVGTGCLIVNNEKEVLLMKRSVNSKNQVGYWSLSGGAVEYGETCENSAIREALEELNVNIKIIELLTFSNEIMPDENQHWVSPTYLAEIESGEIRNLEPNKCDEIKWFGKDNLPEQITSTSKNAIEKYFSKFYAEIK